MADRPSGPAACNRRSLVQTSNCTLNRASDSRISASCSSYETSVAIRTASSSPTLNNSPTPALPPRQRQHPGPSPPPPPREIGNIRAGISPLRSGLPLRGREHRTSEVRHLGARIVDVVLTRHLCARRAQHPGNRIAERRPPGVTNVQRASRIRRHELEVNDGIGKGCPAPIPRPSVHDSFGEHPRCGGIKANIDEPWPRDIHARNTRCSGKADSEVLRDIPW